MKKSVKISVTENQIEAPAGNTAARITDYLKLLRIHQWTKNLFLFAPIFFAGEFLNVSKLLIAVAGFFIFSLASSGIYTINDLFDREKDRLHPLKKFRPLASGKISTRNAVILATLIIGAALFSAYLIDVGLLIIIIIYLMLNLLYSGGLKNISILDIMILSSGFVLRIFAGGVITEIPISQWLLMMTFLMALFIAFAKRREDVLILNKTGTVTRTSVSGYNLEFINSGMSLISSLIIVLYLLYVTSDDIVQRFQDKPVYISALFVLTGIIRYKQITFVEDNSGSPSDNLLRDRFLQICIAGWILFFVYLIYIH